MGYDTSTLQYKGKDKDFEPEDKIVFEKIIKKGEEN